MQPSDSALANHLKRLRGEHGLTLNQLAEKSGVSRATLSRIEKAEVSPTAQTLGSLSSVYRVPISTLLSPMEQQFEPLIRSTQQSVWHDEANGFSRRSVSPPSQFLASELIQGQIESHQIITYDAPPLAGLEHHLFMLEGALTIEVGGHEYQLSQGDCLRYKLFGGSAFRTGDASARYIIALTKGV
ncbi:helix-turn-helix domain-containing protein [Corallincola platygyrae]|uniref:Helix-turn-helix domain-containing protein n=1 Tax=Corallincola platygyrae TaxID=1193278 RepID=A0ABW4XQ22_9GAMM